MESDSSTRDLPAAELKKLKATLGQKSVASTWHAGGMLDRCLCEIARKTPDFQKTRQVQRIAKQVGKNEKRIWQCIEIRNSWSRTDIDLAMRFKLSLRRAVELQPAKKRITEKPEEERAALEKEFQTLIETNPGLARNGEALQHWNEKLQEFKSRCLNDPTHTRNRLRLVKLAAISGLKSVRSKIEELIALLPRSRGAGFKELASRIEDIGDDLSTVFAKSAQEFSKVEKRSLKKSMRTSPLDGDLN